MPHSELKPLESLELDLAQLAAEFPPLWKHDLKQWVFDQVQSRGATPAGTLSYSRWALAELPKTLGNHVCQVQVETEFYTYQDQGQHIWHVNFADPNLFVAYGSELLAQDELQVLEHPLLGSLRELLLARHLPARTRLLDASHASTPVLMAGVPRQCALDTYPDEFQGRPHGLYGRNFRQSNRETIGQALEILDPPTVTNLIAIAAPSSGSDLYTEAQITDILGTAYTAMRAAVQTSSRISQATVIHTGFWGCGAFGGNRVLMTALQLLAARLAELPHLVFHLGSQAEVFPFEEGRALLERLYRGATPSTPVSEIIDSLVALRFHWGKSDGN